MAIRTANKRAYLYGEGQKRQEWGLSLVVVNSRQGGCPNCAKYIGRVFIDDVYSGGKKSDGNYPLLSEAIIGGLFHPRCKDSTSTYYEGITSLEPVSNEEIAEMEERENLEAKQQNAERQEKRVNRLSEYSLDKDNRQKYQHRAKVWQEKAKQLNEKLEETVENTSESGIIKEKDRDYSSVGSNAFSNSAKQKLLQDERIISGNKYETAIVYDSNGNKKFIQKGRSSDVIFSNKQIENMKGCVLTHNHPNGTVFSPNDINVLRRGKLSEMRACNGGGSYVIRNIGDWHKDLSDLKHIETAYWNCMNTIAEKYTDISAQEGKPIFNYFREMDEEGLKLFSDKYGLDFLWEDKI